MQKTKTTVDLDPSAGPDIHCAHTDFVPLDELKPNPKNPNYHPDSQIALLATIIQEQGWRAPITISTRSGYVVRGHGRLMAARKLGLSGAPVDRQSYPSDAAELADMVADNRIAELAGMDEEAVRLICAELADINFDTALAGFPEFGPLDGPGYHFTGGSTPFDGETSPDSAGNSGDGDRSGTKDRPPSIYKIMIECRDEHHQGQLIARFIEEGLKCQSLIL